MSMTREDLINSTVRSLRHSRAMPSDIAMWETDGHKVCEHVRSGERIGYQGGWACFECTFPKPELSKIRQDSESLPSYFLRGYDCEHKRLSPDGDCLDCGS